MSIADKLLTIARNSKTIYDSGIYDAGYHNGHEEGYETGHTQGHEEGYNEGYTEGYEAGGSGIEGVVITDGRTNLKYFYQNLVDTYNWDFWEEYYDEETGEQTVLDLEVTPLEELPFPKGTQNITSFYGFAYLWETVYGYMQDIGVPTKKFTGELDVSGATSLGEMFRNCQWLEESDGIINSENVKSFNYMYQNCPKLKTVHELDISSAASLNSMFNSCEELENINLVNIPKLTSYSSTFAGCKKLKNFPAIDYSPVERLSYTFSSCESMEVAPENIGATCLRGGVQDLSYAFNNCISLKTIPPIKVTGTTSYTGAFNGCSALENLSFNGIIGQSLNVSYSPLLTHDSLMSIINALQKKTSGTYKLQLGSENLAKLTDEEKLIITNKGWQVS